MIGQEAGSCKTPEWRDRDENGCCGVRRVESDKNNSDSGSSKRR